MLTFIFPVNAGLQFLGVLCSIILTVNVIELIFVTISHDSPTLGQLSYRWENARRNELYGKPDEDARVDTHELADRVSVLALDRTTRDGWLTLDS